MSGSFMEMILTETSKCGLGSGSSPSTKETSTTRGRSGRRAKEAAGRRGGWLGGLLLLLRLTKREVTWTERARIRCEFESRRENCRWSGDSG